MKRITSSRKLMAIIVILAILIISLICFLRMNKKKERQQTIDITYTKNCNYVYHMMSVSRCGYDNNYGKKYSKLHSSQELTYLKQKEKYISVAGGDFEGNLYHSMVVEPAAQPDDVDLSLYYKKIAKEAAASEDEESKVTEKIAKIMSNNYKIYCDKVWPDTKKELAAKAKSIQKHFNKKNYLKLWEKTIGYTYKDGFQVMLCNSIDKGPEAIFISDYQDVFGIPMNREHFNYLCSKISHEAGMALFRTNIYQPLIFEDAKKSHKSLEEVSKNDMDNYEAQEALVEYYNWKICGSSYSDFSYLKDIIKWYQKNDKEGTKKPKELYLEYRDRKK